MVKLSPLLYFDRWIFLSDFDRSSLSGSDRIKFFLFIFSTYTVVLNYFSYRRFGERRSWKRRVMYGLFLMQIGDKVRGGFMTGDCPALVVFIPIYFCPPFAPCRRFNNSQMRLSAGGELHDARAKVHASGGSTESSEKLRVS